MVVALEHVAFLVLEMFLWTTPIGHRFFKHPSPEFAKSTAVLAANQGLYNGFLAAGVIWGLFYPDERVGLHILTFLLLCVVIAGAYGGYSVGRKVFLLQGLPAALALVLWWMI